MARDGSVDEEKVRPIGGVMRLLLRGSSHGAALLLLLAPSALSGPPLVRGGRKPRIAKRTSFFHISFTSLTPLWLSFFFASVRRNKTATVRLRTDGRGSEEELCARPREEEVRFAFSVSFSPLLPPQSIPLMRTATCFSRVRGGC